MRNEKIYVLVGMVASGKSTYCKNAAKAGILIMNDDAIVNLVHADDYTLYDKKLKVLYKSIENHVISLGITFGKSVVVDRGLNISIQGRKRWLALADSFDVACEAIVFPNEGAEVHAKRRAANDSRGYDYDYWLKVAKHHDSLFVPPTTTEGFSVVHNVCFDDVKNGIVL